MSSRATVASIATAGVAGTERCSTAVGAVRAPEQIAQLADRGAGAIKLGLEPVQVGDDQPVALLGVGRRQHRSDLGDRHLQPAQPADHLRLRDLTLGVVAVAVAGIDLGRRQQADLVVVAQRLDAEMGGA